MCLATAYLKNDQETENVVLAKNVSNIKIDGELIKLVDILGAETIVRGRLIQANLADGVVEIEAA